MSRSPTAARRAVLKLVQTEIEGAVSDAFDRVMAAVSDVPGGGDMTIQETAGMFAAVLRLSASAVLRASAQTLGDASEGPSQH